ncbi:hypothetical protein ACPF7Z_16755 [Halomonas sp. GXIMD04776]|uniref:hypothetical protein n=1 Tax=Halomonas sp. GXIMD04776 TaxID=3415605 RepID=UPI003CB615C7
MDRVKAIKQKIQNLSSQKLQNFREWFARYDADNWDDKLEANVEAGEFESLADSALADHRAGKSREL